MTRIYLDYAASAPVRPEVERAMRPYFKKYFGNPGATHAEGQAALATLDSARAEIAKIIGADFSGVIFTSGATEANNLAIRGILRNIQSKKPKIITTTVEHNSVLNTVKDLSASGEIEAIYLPVNRKGEMDLKKLEAALDANTILVSVMLVNNETGNVHDVRKISGIINSFKKNKRAGAGGYPILHTDAAQAPNFYDCDLKKLGADLITLSAHKIYGPKGTGALVLSNFVPSSANLISPIQTGSGQEFGLRSGTENIPGVVGLASALTLAVRDRKKFISHTGPLKEKLWRGISEICPDARINGAAEAPHILNVYFPGFLSQDLLVNLDLRGVGVSSGSACAVRLAEPSHVLRALGYDSERVCGSLRFSLGWGTGSADISKTVQIIKTVLHKQTGPANTDHNQ